MMVSEAYRVGVIALAIKGLKLNLSHLVEIRVVIGHVWEVDLLNPTDKRMLQCLQRCKSVSWVNLQNLLDEIVKLNDLLALIDSILPVWDVIRRIFEFDIVPLL